MKLSVYYRRCPEREVLMRLIIGCFLLCTALAHAQNPLRPSFAPIAGISHYVLDDQAITGPTMGIRYLTREVSSTRFSLFAGVTLRPSGIEYFRTEPFIFTDNSQRFQLQPPVYGSAVRATRFAFGLGFFGFDWRAYLADGSVRPYLGVGAELVSWSSNGSFTGTVIPDAKAGLDVHVSSGFNAFVEAQYSYGMPTMFGSRISDLKDLAMFAVGVNFAPRW